MQKPQGCCRVVTAAEATFSSLKDCGRHLQNPAITQTPPHSLPDVSTTVSARIRSRTACNCMLACLPAAALPPRTEGPHKNRSRSAAALWADSACPVSLRITATAEARRPARSGPWALGPPPRLSLWPALCSTGGPTCCLEHAEQLLPAGLCTSSSSWNSDNCNLSCVLPVLEGMAPSSFGSSPPVGSPPPSLAPFLQGARPSVADRPERPHLLVATSCWEPLGPKQMRMRTVRPRPGWLPERRSSSAVPAPLAPHALGWSARASAALSLWRCSGSNTEPSHLPTSVRLPWSFPLSSPQQGGGPRGWTPLSLGCCVSGAWVPISCRDSMNV